MPVHCSVQLPDRIRHRPSPSTCHRRRHAGGNTDEHRYYFPLSSRLRLLPIDEGTVYQPFLMNLSFDARASTNNAWTNYS